MVHHDKPIDPLDWQPATSRPGELYTPEGQWRSIGAFARGLKNMDPRNRNFRRDMRRSGLIAAGGVLAIGIAVALVSAVLG